MRFGPWKFLDVFSSSTLDPGSGILSFSKKHHFPLPSDSLFLPGGGVNGESWCETPLDFRGIFTFQRGF